MKQGPSCDGRNWKLSERKELNMINELLEEGRAEGRKEGLAEGRAEELAKGEINGTLKTLAGLVNDKILSEEEAAKRAGVTEEEIRKML